MTRWKKENNRKFNNWCEKVMRAGARNKDHAGCFVCNWCDELLCKGYGKAVCKSYKECWKIQENLKKEDL